MENKIYGIADIEESEFAIVQVSTTLDLDENIYVNIIEKPCLTNPSNWSPYNGIFSEDGCFVGNKFRIDIPQEESNKHNYGCLFKKYEMGTITDYYFLNKEAKYFRQKELLKEFGFKIPLKKSPLYGILGIDKESDYVIINVTLTDPTDTCDNNIVISKFLNPETYNEKDWKPWSGEFPVSSGYLINGIFKDAYIVEEELSEEEAEEYPYGQLLAVYHKGKKIKYCFDEDCNSLREDNVKYAGNTKKPIKVF